MATFYRPQRTAGTLYKPQRQRKSRKTKSLMSGTMASLALKIFVHVVANLYVFYLIGIKRFLNKFSCRYYLSTDKWQDSKVKYWSVFECPSPSSLRELSNSLGSWPKELVQNRKLRIYIISEKKDYLLRYPKIFENVSLEISVPFNFHPGISRVFGWMVRFSEIQQFPDFLELFLGNFCTIWPGFENFEILVEWKAPTIKKGDVICFWTDSPQKP